MVRMLKKKIGRELFCNGHFYGTLEWTCTLGSFIDVMGKRKQIFGYRAVRNVNLNITNAVSRMYQARVDSILDRFLTKNLPGR